MGDSTQPPAQLGPNAMTCLRATQLAKTYKGRSVVKDVSLCVHSGQIVGLLGPNGAGKTTCFYMMIGLIRADHGQVHLGDHVLTTLPMHQRAQLGLGYLPQEASVFRRLSVKDNILAVLQLSKALSRSQQQQHCDRLLDEFNIGHLRNSLGMALSGGERRRVEIARALAMSPQFILLDEPFAGVDPISIGDIKQIILHLQQRQIGVLITDHNVRETLDICEQAYIVGDGRIIASGDTASILDNQQVKDTYLGEHFRL